MSNLEPKYWTDERFPAPLFDRYAIQKELDRICGTADGHSKIRLVFGSEEEELKESQISDLGTGLGVRKVGRYLTRIDGKMVRIRRWIFEEWQPPELFACDDGMVMLPGAGGFYVPPESTNRKIHGDWEMVYIVADHDRCGCAPNDYSCMGEYRSPGAKDLKNFMRMTAAAQDAAIKADPFSPMSKEMLSKLQQAENQRLLEDELIRQAAEDEVFEDRAKTRKKHSVS